MNVGDRVDINPRARIDAAKRQWHNDRNGAIATLNDIFRKGTVPDAPLNGPYRGELVALSWNPVLDILIRFFNTLDLL